MIGKVPWAPPLHDTSGVAGRNRTMPVALATRGLAACALCVPKPSKARRAGQPRAVHPQQRIQVSMLDTVIPAGQVNPRI